MLEDDVNEKAIHNLFHSNGNADYFCIQFDPVTLTLKLMDDSSVGKKKDYKAFQRVLYNLDMALKTIVNGNLFQDKPQK